MAGKTQARKERKASQARNETNETDDATERWDKARNSIITVMRIIIIFLNYSLCFVNFAPVYGDFDYLQDTSNKRVSKVSLVSC